MALLFLTEMGLRQSGYPKLRAWAISRRCKSETRGLESRPPHTFIAGVEFPETFLPYHGMASDREKKAKPVPHEIRGKRGQLRGVCCCAWLGKQNSTAYSPTDGY